MIKLVVFSDLDGTLLDHHTYSHAAAAPAVAALLKGGHELVLTSSKTRAEMLDLWDELGLASPFISENGGGVFLPSDHPLAGADCWRPAGPGWLAHKLGLPVEELRERFAPLAETIGAKGFGQMSDREVAELTGLPLAKAAKARQREFNEPYFLPNPERDGDRFYFLAKKAGLSATRGGRFFHLLGGGDKGRAVRFLGDLFRLRAAPVFTVGLGDAPNDLSMLDAVDHPVQVARSDGTYAPLNREGLHYAGGPGPIGWNMAVLHILDNIV